MITEITYDSKIVGLLTDLSPISKYKMLRYDDLAFIATPCTGIDHIDTEYCKDNSIDIIYLDQTWKDTEGREISSTAEHTLSLMLQLAKRKKMQLRGKTLGIIGCGRIGWKMYKYAIALDMNVLVHDKNPKVPSVPLCSLFAESDIISIHLPLNNETTGFIGQQEFMKMQKSPLIINTARPNIIDKEALEDALDRQLISGYADDFMKERLILNLDVIQTFHIGGNCNEARVATDSYIYKKIDEYIKTRFQGERNG